LSVKNHNFYDSGVYDLGTTNQATAYGLGIQAQRRVTKRIGINVAYSFALADSLEMNDGFTRNAAFHQVEGNLTLQPKNFKRVRPYLFTGYTANFLPQLQNLGEQIVNLNINLGVGLEVKVKEQIGLAYQSTYGFSLSEALPYNFRHQLGVVLYPKRFNERMRQVPKEYTSEPVTSFYNQDSVSQLVDSLKQVIAKQEQQGDTENTKLNLTSIEKSIAMLELENQLLLEELRSHRFLTDSIYTKDFAAYTVMGVDGEVLPSEAAVLSSGYYILSEGFKTFKEAQQMGSSDTYTSFGSIRYLNREITFSVLGYVGSDRDDAVKLFQTLRRSNQRVSLVRIP